jgi:hypothetical protein
MAGSVFSGVCVGTTNVPVDQCACRRENVEKRVHDGLRAAGDETHIPSRCVEQYDVASAHAKSPQVGTERRDGMRRRLTIDEGVSAFLCKRMTWV